MKATAFVLLLLAATAAFPMERERMSSSTPYEMSVMDYLDGSSRWTLTRLEPVVCIVSIQIRCPDLEHCLAREDRFDLTVPMCQPKRRAVRR
jgi:hypothetical protein